LIRRKRKTLSPECNLQAQMIPQTEKMRKAENGFLVVLICLSRRYRILEVDAAAITKQLLVREKYVWQRFMRNPGV